MNRIICDRVHWNPQSVPSYIVDYIHIYIFLVITKENKKQNLRHVLTKQQCQIDSSIFISFFKFKTIGFMKQLRMKYNCTIFLKWNFKSSSNSQSGFQTRTKIYNKTICWSGHNLHLVPWCHISILLVVNDHGFTTMPLSLLVTIRWWWRSLWRL